MKTQMLTMIGIAMLVALAPLTGFAQEGTTKNTGGVTADPEAKFVPTGAKKLLVAKSFTLGAEYEYLFSKDKPKVKEGTVLVVQVDPEMSKPRQTEMPILFVNRRPAEITNFGLEKGNLVVIVPGKLDLENARVYYGTPGVAEQVDAAKGTQELAAAEKAGVRPFSKREVTRALRRGGDAIQVANVGELYSGLVADLIERFSPAEKEQADGYRTWKN